MSRSARGALAALVMLALAVPAIILPISAANAVDWSTVPGARSDDLIVTPISAGTAQTPGFSYTARSSGMADYCAATDPAGAWPCPTVDYHSYFTLRSATVTGRTATVTLVANVPNFGLNWLSMTSWMSDHWEQVFSTNSHGWVYYPEIIGGTQVGQSNQKQVVCTIGVLCTVSYGLNDDYTRFTGDKWLAAQVNGSQIFIPLTGQTTPAVPPTAAFSATFTGSHTWSFDAAASTATTGQTVRSYQWTFGDGRTATTSTPSTTHIYADSSAHTASLVVVDSAGTASESVSHRLTEPDLVVNSTGDAPATDPRTGCDTGSTIASGARECTLRAAIQALDAGVGGTTITFSIPAGSTITTGSALPDITRAGAKLDGGAIVPIVSGSPLHVKGAAGVTITKMCVIGSGQEGVYFENSAGATLTSSYIGVTPAGRVSAPKWAVDVPSSGTVTIGGSAATGNVIVGTVGGLSVAAGGPISSLQVIGNSIGFRPDGTLVAGTGASLGGFIVGSSYPLRNATIQGNRIAGATTNLAVIGSQTISPTISGNTIGVAPDQDTVLGTTAVNLRLDGVAGARVTGNQIAGASSYDVLVSGSMQTSADPDGQGAYNIHFRFPGDSDVLTGPVTGTGDILSGNRIGTLTRKTGAAGVGVQTWNTANDTTISDNTILNHDDKELWVTGAAQRMRVTDNTVGRPVGVEASVNTGMLLESQTAPVVSGNTVGGEGTAIDLPRSSNGAVLSGNTIGMWTDGSTADPVRFGISVAGANATIGPGNTVGNASGTGIDVSGTGARVFSNRIGIAKFGSRDAPNAIGLRVRSSAVGAVIGGRAAGNTIVGNGTGVEIDAVGTEVADNALGVITGGTRGNGTAIRATVSSWVHDNTIAASTVAGVAVTPGAVVRIQHNSIYGTADAAGIVTSLAGPTVTAAVREQAGSSARTWLVLSGVPTQTGTIEVFGNATCDDPEGKVPLFTTPTTSSASRVLSVQDRTQFNGLTVTVTTAAGTTAFSTCVPVDASPADTDGDGIPDAVEAAYPASPGAAASAGSAVFVGDNQNWVVMTAVSFDKDYPNPTFTHVAPIDDPAPSGHPGATFPVGLIDWTVTGVRPGAFATVNFSLPGTVISGWWKYNPRSTPAFFAYGPHAGRTPSETYGARVFAADLPVVGLSTNVILVVPDGGYGDDDGLKNGTVHDPSAPAVMRGASTPPPAPPSTPSPRPAGGTTALAATGSSGPGDAMAFGILSALAGVAMLLTRRRARRSPW